MCSGTSKNWQGAGPTPALLNSEIPRGLGLLSFTSSVLWHGVVANVPHKTLMKYVQNMAVLPGKICLKWSLQIRCRLTRSWALEKAIQNLVYPGD